MRYLRQILVPVFLLIALPAAGAEITSLAECSTKVFNEVNRTQKWSGKAPAGCTASVAAEKRPGGLFVTVWAVEPATVGWIRTAFSSALSYAELADKKVLARANREIMARATRLERCLNSIKATNDPQECRIHATKSYRIDEVTGIENSRLIWLDDNGRHTVVEYTSGDTDESPTPPADLFEAPPLPPGAIINLFRKI